MSAWRIPSLPVKALGDGGGSERSRVCKYIYSIDATMPQEYLCRALKEASPMERYLICENAKCRFVLDRRIDGKSLDGADIVKKCPACGGAWSPSCPACSQTLAVKLVGELPHIICCDRKPNAKARAA
jgi:hypothetical protein